MKKWELARYLIDAKKRIDSMCFIEEHLKELKYVNIREIINNNFLFTSVLIFKIVEEKNKQVEIDRYLKDANYWFAKYPNRPMPIIPEKYGITIYDVE